MTAALYSHYVLQMLDGSRDFKIRTFQAAKFDWSARREDHDGPCMGYGPTEQAAITDLLRQILDYKLRAIQRKVDKVLA